MPHRMLIGTLVVVVVTAAGLPAQDEKPADAKISTSRAHKLLKDWIGGKEKRAESARQLLERTRPDDRKNIVAAFAKGVYVRPKRRIKAGTHTFKIEAEKGVAAGHYIVDVPKKYTGKKPYPVVFRFHGSGDTGEDYHRNTWNLGKLGDSFLAVAPTIPSQERRGWNEKGVQGFVDRVYRRILRDFNVDTNRVYYGGHSAGGGAAAIFTQMTPHRMAAFISRARIYCKYHPSWEDCMDTGRLVPGFFVVGLLDTKERVDGYRVFEKYYKEKGYPGVFHFVKGMGHEYADRFDKQAFQFALKHERVKPPRNFTAFFYRYQDDDDNLPFKSEQYWIKANRFGGGRVRADVSVEGNTIHIKATDRLACELRLNDDIVDLDQEVVVIANGKELFRGKVERSVAFLLDHFAADRDPNRLFWNRIEIDIPK